MNKSTVEAEMRSDEIFQWVEESNAVLLRPAVGIL